MDLWVPKYQNRRTSRRVPYTLELPTTYDLVRSKDPTFIQTYWEPRITSIQDVLTTLSTLQPAACWCIVLFTLYSAWDLFSSVWLEPSVFYNNSAPPNYTAFTEYFNWTAQMQSQQKQPVFYAGSGQCPDVVHSYVTPL